MVRGERDRERTRQYEERGRERERRDDPFLAFLPFVFNSFS